MAFFFKDAFVVSESGQNVHRIKVSRFQSDNSARKVAAKYVIDKAERLVSSSLLNQLQP